MGFKRGMLRSTVEGRPSPITPPNAEALSGGIRVVKDIRKPHTRNPSESGRAVVTGRLKSSRVWKHEQSDLRKRSRQKLEGSMTHRQRSYEEKKATKRDLDATREFEKEIKEKLRAARKQKREKTQAKRERKKEQEIRALGRNAVQVIRDTTKVSKWSKNAKRSLQKMSPELAERIARGSK